MATLTLSEQIARYAIETDFSQTRSTQQDELFHILKLSLMDWCSVGRAGADEPVSRVVRSLNLSDAGSASASIFGSAQRLPARAAAQVNGTTSHALDYDDTHFHHVGHTSVVVFSTAFAVAQLQDSTWHQLLDAALIGSETCCHVGHWLGRSHYQAGFHQTATAGTFGATVTACRLLGLDVDGTAHALGLASTMASGLTSQFGTMGKPFHAGMAAANGVQAALLAARGFKSRTDALECAQGFAQTHHVDTATAATIEFQPGRQSVFADVQHKLHACCHGLHASLEGLDQLRRTHIIDPQNIKQIQIHANPRWLDVCNVAKPQTALESKFSFSHTASLMLSGYDTAALDTYSDAVCQETALHAVRDCTVVQADESLADTQAIVHIHLKSGQTHRADYDLSDPLPLTVRQEKLLAKCTSLLGADHCMNLWNLIENGQSMAIGSFAAAVMNQDQREGAL